MKRHSRLAPVTALLVLALAAPAAADHTESQRVNRDLEGWMVGDFSLIDHNGRAFTQARLSGQWTFVLFGDTRCSERCTSALAALAGMCRRIARTEAVKTTQVLRRYLAPFDERFIGARGSRETLARLVEDLIPPGTRAAGGAGSLVLIGPDRDVRGEFLPPYDVLLLTAQFLKTRVGR